MLTRTIENVRRLKQEESELLVKLEEAAKGLKPGCGLRDYSSSFCSIGSLRDCLSRAEGYEIKVKRIKEGDPDVNTSHITRNMIHLLSGAKRGKILSEAGVLELFDIPEINCDQYLATLQDYMTEMTKVMRDLIEGLSTAIETGFVPEDTPLTKYFPYNHRPDFKGQAVSEEGVRDLTSSIIIYLTEARYFPAVMEYAKIKQAVVDEFRVAMKPHQDHFAKYVEEIEMYQASGQKHHLLVRH